MLNSLKELFKDFKFTRIDLKPGNEMIRTSWFGRHDFVPYVRVDLWVVGFRISYDPNYKEIFFKEYAPKFKEYQRVEVLNFTVKYNHERYDELVEVCVAGTVIKEHPLVWKEAIKFSKARGWPQ